MKKVKKYIKNLKTLFLHREQIALVKEEVAVALGEVKFQFASFGGADINYYLLQEKKRVGMLRLAIADHADSDVAIVRFVKQKRLAKEYEAYSKGSQYGLTPKVLFASSDALVCEYLEGKRAFDVVKDEKHRVWEVLFEAIEVYTKLHALGVTHLDATLKNFVVTSEGMKVIDFEYYPSEALSLETQKAYDYVRIIEHTLRMIPKEEQEGYAPLVAFLKQRVPSEVKDASFDLVYGWLKNIENYPLYEALRKEVFTKL